MIILDPIATAGDTTFSRAGPGTYVDKDGVMRTAAANVFRVTYTPSDLSAAPYALVEPAATNMLAYSQYITGLSISAVGTVTGEGHLDLYGTNSALRFRADSGNFFYDGVDVPQGAQATGSIYVKALAGHVGPLYIKLSGNAGVLIPSSISIEGPGTAVDYNGQGGDYAISGLSTSVWTRICITNTSATETNRLLLVGSAGSAFVDIVFSNRQVEVGPRATSHILTTGAPVTRAADVLGAAGAVLNSNVAEVEAPAWSAAATYAAGQQVMSGHVIYQSKVGANTNQLPPNATFWLSLGSTNQRKMIDALNNTQTQNADRILLTLTPRAISPGVYLGNLDANSVTVAMVDPTDGVVYSLTKSLIISDSASSFFNWAFKRIRRQNYFFTGQLPMYSSSTITIGIEKVGSVAKCGMCCVGPLIDIGLSQHGLSTEIKDYSSTTFEFDGTSATVVRGYAKRMSVDVVIDNELIDSVQQQLADFRQKPVVFVGAAMFDSAILYGKYSSFKNVIESFPRSKMTLQIEGMV